MVQELKEMSPEELLSKLESQHGLCLDFELTLDQFKCLEPKLEETSRTRVTDRYPEAISYRDDRSRRSLHVTDYRGMEREDAVSNVIVAHIENFNPEKHPLMHVLIDFPLWYWRNRIKTRNKL